MPIKRNGQKLSAKSLILGKRGRKREPCIFTLFAKTSSASTHEEGPQLEDSESYSVQDSVFNSKRLLRGKFSCMILVLSPQTRKKK